MRRHPESLGAIIIIMSTRSGYLVLLVLVVSLVSCDVIKVTKSEKEGEGDDLGNKFQGYKISYESVAGNHPGKVYDIQLPQLACLQKGSYIELFAKVDSKITLAVFLQVTSDFKSYQTQQTSEKEYDLSIKDKLCFFYGHWSPLGTSGSMKVLLYINFLTAKTVFEETDILFFGLLSNDKHFLSSLKKNKKKAENQAQNESPKFEFVEYDSKQFERVQPDKNFELKLDRQSFSHEGNGVFAMVFIAKTTKFQFVDLTEEEIDASDRNVIISDAEMVYNNNVITVTPSIHHKLVGKQKDEQRVRLIV